MTTTPTSTSGTFRFGGLATGLDTNSIIDALANAEKAPETKLQSQQSAIDVKVSSFGQLSSKLLALRTAMDDLQTSGLRGVRVASTTSSLSVSAGAHARPGTFAVQVTQLAVAARAMSSSFPTGVSAVPAGTLTIAAGGVNTDVTIGAGSTLADVADAINASGAAVTASVLDTGHGAYLSVVRNDTGFPVGGDPATALSFSGDAAAALGLAVTQAAKNATFDVDGLPFERSSNAVDDAIPGVSLALQSVSAAPENVVLATDTDGTAANLQKFVSAYNDTISFVQGQLDIKPDTDRDRTLASESLLQQIQHSLQSLIVQASPTGTSSVRALADLGIRSGRDGSLTLDTATLSKALARDGRAVDGLLAGSGGIAASFDTFVHNVADGADSAIAQRQEVLGQRRRSLDDQIAQIDRRVAAYKTMLVNQFTAMETLVSGLNAQNSALNSLNNTTNNNGSKS